MREARKGDAKDLWDSRVEGQVHLHLHLHTCTPAHLHTCTPAHLHLHHLHLHFHLHLQANELNYDAWHLRDALSRTGIALDRHAISTLALTEPRSFRSLVAVAAAKTSQGAEEGGLGRGGGAGPGVPVIGHI